MKLTKRERVLLFGALIIVVIAVFFTYVYLPLTKEIEALKVQSEDLTIQLQEAQTKQGLVKDMEKQLIVIREDVKTKQDDILPIWDQAELLVFVEETIDELCERESINFFDPTEVSKVKTGEIGITLKTNYEDLQKIWDKLENAKYFNTVTSFDIAEIEENSQLVIKPEVGVLETDSLETDNNQKNLEVTMNLRFYSQNLINEYPNEYEFMNGKYGKTNIFE